MATETILAIALPTVYHVRINIHYIVKGERSLGPPSSTLHILYNM